MKEKELIVKQQLEIEGLKQTIESYSKRRIALIGMLYSVGQPLNDNVVQMNGKQLEWCYKLAKLIEG